jgi:hypothetical protein
MINTRSRVIPSLHPHLHLPNPLGYLLDDRNPELAGEDRRKDRSDPSTVIMSTDSGANRVIDPGGAKRRVPSSVVLVLIMRRSGHGHETKPRCFWLPPELIGFRRRSQWGLP